MPRLFARRGITLLSAQQWSATLAAVCAFLACAVSGELGPVMLALFVAALGGALFAGQRDFGKAEWLWTAFIFVAFAVLAGRVLAGSLDVVLASAQFVELLLVHRLWHRRTQRDELLLLLLSLLLLCAGAALAAELTFGFAFIGFAVTATWAMALTHLRFEIEAGRGPSGSAALLHSRRIATPALLSALAALAVMALLGAAVLFFIFPRVNIGGLRRRSSAQPVAGLSDRVDLSRHGTIADDPRVVLRVRLDPAPPGFGDLAEHWRARAFDVWTGSGWRAREGDAIPALRLPPRPGAQRRPRVLAADIEVVAGFSAGVVFIPEGWPLSVEFRRPMSARPSAQRLYRDRAGDLFYQPVDVGDLRYLAVVDRDEPGLARLRGRGREYPPEVEEDVHAPANLDPRVAALALRLGGGKDPADAAFAIERWLTTSLGYTRELPGEVKDPIADFLFERRRGHCELFSSAMVLMLRSLGIPARNVTGYFGGTRTDSGYYAVRAGDAHSWVEVYFPSLGWSSFDPTPPSHRGSRQSGLWPRAVLFWDALQQRWRAFVVDYDLVSQAQAMRLIGQLLRDAGRRFSGKAGAAPRARVVLLGIAALLGSWILWRAVLWRWRSGRRSILLEGDRKRAARLWRKARARLARAGIALAPSTTAQEAARRAPQARELISAYLAARWGGEPLPPDRARALLRELDARISRR